MRKTLIALALAAAALTAGTSASQAVFKYNFLYQPTPNRLVFSHWSCRDVTYKVYDTRMGDYVTKSRKFCS